MIGWAVSMIMVHCVVPQAHSVLLYRIEVRCSISSQTTSCSMCTGPLLAGSGFIIYFLIQLLPPHVFSGSSSSLQSLLAFDSVDQNVRSVSSFKFSLWLKILSGFCNFFQLEGLFRFGNRAYITTKFDVSLFLCGHYMTCVSMLLTVLSNLNIWSCVITETILFCQNESEI